MDRPVFTISPTEAKSMAESSSLTLPQLLPSLVTSAQSLARPPISNFRVAAVGLSQSGRILIGVNIEFPGLPLHHSIHAEQFLLTNLFLNNETNLHSFAVSAAPCGHCRQFLQELRGASDIQIIVTSESDPKFTSLSQFLPYRFGPHDLLPENAPLLLEPRNNGLKLKKKLANGVCNGNTVNEKLKIAALEALNKSHAPYSDSPSGVAILDCNGKIYKGCYVESAAFNPSLGPLQVAVVAFIAGGGGEYDEIVGAVLVEKDGAVVKQEGTVKLLLEAISPKCELQTFLCSYDQLN
ncbi:cytidine deaminase [Trifolium pratense]|uniref:cytidine deaminase n=3 Tax=Trifolium TaxID=3898 RepID=A0A2K3MT27_TRIPR|nr:cytidine deaminase 1-like [Trifolium pratense]PNX93978.1 cytidine deaminase [Trifolium pratense]